MSEVRVSKCGADKHLDVSLCEIGSRLLILTFNDTVTFEEGQDMEIMLLYKKYIVTWVNYRTKELIQKVIRTRKKKPEVLYDFVVDQLKGKLSLQYPATEIEIQQYLYSQDIGVVINDV